jgi:hypothetical protein
VALIGCSGGVVSDLTSLRDVLMSSAFMLIGAAVRYAVAWLNNRTRLLAAPDTSEGGE